MAGIVLAIAGLTALWGGITQYSGHEAQERYAQAGQRVNQKTMGLAKLTVTGYQGKFLKSRADWELALQTDPCDPSKKYILRGYDEIHYGLTPDLKAAKITTHILWPAELRQKLAQVYGTKEPLQITTTVSLFGKRRTQIINLPFTYTDSDKKLRYRWDGATADITKTRKGQTYGVVESPGLKISSTDPDKKASIGYKELMLAFTGNTIQNLLDTDNRAKIAQVFVQMAPNRSLELNNVNYHDVVQAVPDAAYDRQSRVNIGSVVWNGNNIGQLNARLGFQAANSNTVSQMQQDMRKLENSCQPAASSFADVLRPLFNEGFKLTLDDLDLNLDETHVRAKALLTVDTQALQKDDQIAALIEKLRFDGKLDIEKAYLRRFIDQTQANSSEAELKKNLSKALKNAAARGYLQEGDSGYSLTLHLDEKGLFANDQLMVEQGTFVKTVSETVAEQKAAEEAAAHPVPPPPPFPSGKQPEPGLSPLEKRLLYHHHH